MNKRGRKERVYSEKELTNIIYKFKEKHNHVGIIKYLDVHKYSEELYNREVINIKLSEDFWRKSNRQGRILIDKINELYLSTLRVENENNTKFIETEYVINQYNNLSPKDKKEIIQKLKINEVNARKTESLNKKLEMKESENRNLIEKISIKDEQISSYQRILFSWLAASYASNNVLLNMINTGKNKDPMIEHSFNELFSNADEGYKMFEDYVKNIINTNSNSNANITDIKSTRIEKLLGKK